MTTRKNDDTEVPAPPEELADPFDPAALRISGDAEISTERVLTAVPVRKPKRDEFFRVHPGDDYTIDALVVERDDDLDREIYVVVPRCAEAVLEVARGSGCSPASSKRGDRVPVAVPSSPPTPTAGAGTPRPH